ncbi:homologous-pairing protein-like protein 2 [Westerdykella ornata]|uniref:Homologous-pairing protein-like protein 2 n=1 Tax=Westerdykella ornata TaxID=318751 RepID=A0A6A6JLV2_WESOR|nr:homologous-pairing protein-like protein 2 [Westerdykella ornata]KAF2277571.1 homologous-pairing protein-like protein 2 [Westerdykella ornata]
MAPRKEKTEKVSANEAADTILNYLRKQNRPYSATDISANLHNKVTKAAAAKILKDLQDQNKIEGRAAGKQVVYHTIQNTDDALTPEQLAALSAQTSDLQSRTTALQTTIKTLRSTLSTLNSTLSTADLVSSVQSLEAEKRDILARLETLKTGKAKKVTQKERMEAEAEWRKWNGIAKRRERIEREMWRMIEDLVGEKDKREELREALGLDE